MAFPFSFLAEEETPNKGLPYVVLAENHYVVLAENHYVVLAENHYQTGPDSLGEYLYLLRFPDGVFQMRVVQSIRPSQDGREWILCYESFLFSDADSLIRELQAALTQLYEWGIYFPALVEQLESGFTETVRVLDSELAETLEPHITTFLQANDTSDYR